jgi:hypothetical protein
MRVGEMKKEITEEIQKIHGDWLIDLLFIKQK